MNANFKPLGLAAAVATVTAGYAGVVNAQDYAAATELGDLAIVPYYTVMDGYATGVNIINSSEVTFVWEFINNVFALIDNDTVQTDGAGIDAYAVIF